MRHLTVVFFLPLAFVLFLTPNKVLAQNQDSGSTVTRTPQGALWRAALVPGWGQIYNKQYVKLPFVYGAMGGLLIAAISVNKNYQLYRDAFLYKAYQEQVDAGISELNPYEGKISSYNRLVQEFGSISSGTIRAQRDVYRRNRDLSYLGAGLIYALSVLDAYVSAHLLDFNVDENLGFRVVPDPIGVRLQARFIIP